MYSNEKIVFKQLIIDNLQWLGTSLAIIVAWFRREIKESFVRKSEEKKNDVDIQGINIENIARSVEVYKKIIDDIVPRYETQLKDYREQLKDYSLKLDEYRKELKERDREIISLHKEVNELRSRVLFLEKNK